MTTNRIEWSCPGCNKRFAIPSNIETPRYCPDCSESTPTSKIQEPVSRPSTQKPNTQNSDMERIEWTCPGCQQRFAIPENIETPSLCPACETSQADSHQQQSTPIADPAPATAPLPSSMADSTQTESTRDNLDSLPELPQTFISSRRAQRLLTNKYPILNFISIFYKASGVLIFLFTIIGTVIRVTQATLASGEAAATSNEAGSIQLIYMLLAGTFVAICCYAFGELISLLIDIESNTRRHQQPDND